MQNKGVKLDYVKSGFMSSSIVKSQPQNGLGYGGKTIFSSNALLPAPTSYDPNYILKENTK